MRCLSNAPHFFCMQFECHFFRLIYFCGHSARRWYFNCFLLVGATESTAGKNASKITSRQEKNSILLRNLIIPILEDSLIHSYLIVI